jgi:hypothetical protein
MRLWGWGWGWVGLAALGCGQVVDDVGTLRVGTQAVSTSVNLDESHDASMASMAIDGSGVTHVVYFDGETSRPRYAECVNQCNSIESWRFVALPEVAPSAVLSALALDPAGRPRFVIHEPAAAALLYASCDAACTSASSWHVTRLAAPKEETASYLTIRRIPLTLDAKGQASVAYHSGDTEITVKSCAAGCENASRWTERIFATQTFTLRGVAPAHFFPTSLAVDSSGTLHLSDDASDYAQIPLNGSLTPLVATAPMTEDQTWPLDARLQLDSLGQPRVLSTPFTYASCAKDCGAAHPWTWTLDVSSIAAVPSDFVLDSKGRPQVALIQGNPRGDLVYAHCTANCDTSHAAWETQVIQSASDLDKSTPVPTSFDAGGVAKQIVISAGPGAIALNAQGAPRFLYTVSRAEFCTVTSESSICPSTLRYSAP